MWIEFREGLEHCIHLPNNYIFTGWESMALSREAYKYSMTKTDDIMTGSWRFQGGGGCQTCIPTILSSIQMPIKIENTNMVNTQFIKSLAFWYS